MPKNKLTDTDWERLQAYLDEMDALAASEPEYNFGMSESADAWEKWNAETIALNEKYHDVIGKALTASIDDWSEDSPASVAQILRAFVEKDDLEVQKQLLKISKYGLMKDKASWALLSQEPEYNQIDGQLSLTWGVNQAGAGKKDVPVLIALTYEGTDAKVNKKVTGFDELVVITVSNMIYAQKNGGIPGPWDFSTNQIWREMNGITDSRKTPSGKQTARISASLDKLRFTHLLMDLSHEYEAHYISYDNIRVKNGIADENYIIASKRRIKTVKGKPVEVYRFYEVPFIYEYNLTKGHIVYVSFDLLDTSDETRDNEYTSVFRVYLLREIARMYKRERENVILYKTLYRDTATPTPEERASEKPHKTENAYKTTISNEAKNDRERISAILRSWTKDTKGNWILGFEPVKSGNRFTGVKIILNPANYEKKQLSEK